MISNPLRWFRRERYRDKLAALLDGLEIQQADVLLARGKVEDYHRLGLVISQRIKLLRIAYDECKVLVDTTAKFIKSSCEDPVVEAYLKKIGV